jgi:hypothetical protein
VLRATGVEEAGAAAGGVSVKRVLSQEQDADDDLPVESSAKRRSSKANKKKGGDQEGSACKTAPWATLAKKARAVAAGVGLEANSWPAPLRADVQQATSILSAAAATAEAEALFMSKFGKQESKVRQHQLAYSVDDLYCE